MAEEAHVYKKTEIVGTSTKGIEDAVQHAIARAHRSLRNLRWFEVGEIRGSVKDGQVENWQVTLRVGFTLE